MPIETFTFPQWTNKIKWVVLIVLVTAPVYVVLMVAYGASPETIAVGYQPAQPVAYSHALHAGELGMDCRYCHTAVDTAAHASIPSTQICMNCHQTVFGESEKLQVVRESYATGQPIPWVRIHDLPDYAYFNHSAHVNRGVGCVECHGRVDKMGVNADNSGVYQAEPLSMGWCLDCHRNPERFLRPLEKITDMAWQRPEGEDGLALGRALVEEYNIRSSKYLTNCSVCHR